MILGNDWREFDHIRIKNAMGQYWELEYAGGGLSGTLVWTWNEDDDLEDLGEPVPRYYSSRRNGDVHNQDVEQFCPGFVEALMDRDTIIWIMD